MRIRNLVAFPAVLSMFLSSGCSSEYWTSTWAESKTLHEGDVVFSSADVRAVYHTVREGNAEADGEPATSVICAEPSPDVAKIASASFSGDLAGAIADAGGVANARLAAGLALARSEGLAQLGQRLATIQLLRDGQYRACEAYANDAIGAEEYALMLSRYDDVMVTLLLAEFGAASATRTPVAQLVGAAGAGGGSVVAPAQGSREAMKALIEADKTLTRKEAERDAAEAALEAADAGSEAAEKAAEKLESLENEVDNARTNVERIEDRLDAARKAAQGDFAAAMTGGPASGSEAGGTSNVEAVAAAMTMMQEAYLDDVNLDPVMVACLRAASSSNGSAGTGENGLSRLCDQLTDGDLLTNLRKLRMLNMLGDGADPDALRERAEQLQALECVLPDGDDERCGHVPEEGRGEAGEAAGRDAEDGAARGDAET